MKLNWAFVGVIAFVGFMLGFVKPFLNADIHLVVSLFTYWLVWYFFRNKSTTVDAASHAKWSRWILLFAFIFTVGSFLNQFNPPNIPLSIAFDFLIVLGIAYCSSLRIRLWVGTVNAKVSKPK